MDDLTTGGLAGSEELSLAFFALVRGSVVTLVPLLAQVFEANWLACGQIIDKSVWTGLLVIKKPLDCLGDAAGIAAKPLWSKSAIGQVVGHGEFANFCAR